VVADLEINFPYIIDLKAIHHLNMTREERLEYCKVCTNRSFDPKHGIICGLTNKVADFDCECPEYNPDNDAIASSERVKAIRKDETKSTINKGRIALFVIGGLYILTGFLEAYVLPNNDILYGYIDWGIAAAFIGLGIWSYKKPALALTIGLIFYIAIILLLAAIDASTIFEGIIWKILIITYLIYAISTARKEGDPNPNKSSDELLDQMD
jgi:hypothetical protein